MNKTSTELFIYFITLVVSMTLVYVYKLNHKVDNLPTKEEQVTIVEDAIETMLFIRN